MIRFVILMSLINIHATAQNFRIKIYTTEDGLPANYIFGASQCSNRHLYVGTVNGASRFDGTEFRNFGSEVNIQSFFVDRVFEDAQQRLWFGNRGGIVLLKNQKTSQIFPLDDSARINFTTDIFTSDDNKTIWLTDKGRYEFEGTYWKKLESLCPPNAASQGAVLNGATYLNYGRKIAIQKNGLTTLVGIDDARQPYYPYYRLMRRCNEKIFVSTNSEFFALRGDSLYSLFTTEFNPEKNQFIYWYLQDRKGRFWFATDRGLLVSAPNSEKITHRFPALNTIVSDIFQDDEDNIWLATSNGLMKITETSFQKFFLGQKFKRHSSFVDKAGRLIAYDVSSQPDERGIYIWSNGTLKKRSLNVPYDEVIDAYAEDPEGNIWLGGRFGHVFQMTPQNLTQFIADAEAMYVRTIAYNSNEDRLYVCGRHITTLRKGVSSAFELSGPDRISDIGSIFFDHSEGMWICTSAGSVYFVKNGKTRKMNDSLGLREIHLSGAGVFSEDKKGRIWIAYPGKGLRCYHWENDRIVQDFEITTRCQLPDNFVISFVLDVNDNLWAVTNSGPVFINLKERYDNGCFSITHIETDTDIRHDWPSSAVHRFPNNDIGVATTQYLYVFKPDAFNNERQTPKTILETMVIKNVSYLADSVMLTRETTEPEFAFDQNNITFNYHAASFTEGKMLYSYRLRGNTDEWSQPSPAKSVSFLNIKPGDYSFDVKSKLSNTDWGKPISYHFFIKPPFWQLWWFRALVVTSAIGSVLGWAFWYTSRLKAKQRVVNQITELELKALKSQMNPHFIFNAMNSIQSLIANEKPSEALKYTSKFSKLLRIVLEDSEKNLIPLEKEINALELYIQIEALRLNFQLAYTIEVGKNVVTELELIPPMLIQPYVENALWHGLSDKKTDRRLWVNFSIVDEILHVEVIDNGIGRVKAKELKMGSRTTSLGHAITEKRLSLVNQFKKALSVDIIDLYDGGIPSGTKVIIKVNRRPERRH